MGNENCDPSNGSFADQADGNGLASLASRIEELLAKISKIQTLMAMVVDPLGPHSQDHPQVRDAWKNEKYREYDQLYVEIQAYIDSFRDAGVELPNPNRWRDLWEWTNAQFQGACGQLKRDYWLEQHYRPLVD